MDGQDQNSEIGCHVIARFMEDDRGRSVENEATSMEVYDDRELGLRWGVERAKHTNVGVIGGVEWDILGESELG